MTHLIMPIIKLFAVADDDDNDGDGDADGDGDGDSDGDGDVFHYTLWAPQISFEDNDDNHDSRHFVSTQN